MTSNFSIYKALPEPLINILTSIVVCELQHLTNVSSVQRLPLEFCKRGDSSPPESKMKSKFWYKKLNGVPFRFKEDFDKVCSYFPEIKNILLHPVWQLLSKPTCTEEEIKKLAASLPLHVQKQIISQKTLLITATREPYKFLLLDPCDAMFCLVAYYLKSPSKEAAVPSYCMTTSLILSLFSTRYSKSPYGMYYYSILWALYEPFTDAFVFSRFVDSDGKELFIADTQSPLSTNLFTCVEKFFVYLEEYDDIITTAYEKLEFLKDLEEARRFVLMTPNSQLHELIWNLECYPEYLVVGQRRTQLAEAIILFKKYYISKISNPS